ncbi:MAG: DUF418 domain-containing protein, partial [Rhodospirillales bacterium]|nr:DUF418 domain-containing protein [Rhodospirillales bacterium]
FSLLFGAGIVLMYERRDIAGLPSAGVHYRRMAGLLAMGVVHAYAIWYGDILVAYALCGLWLFPLRKCGPILLIILGAVLLLIGGGINFALGALIFLSPEAVAQVEASIQPDPATIAWEIEAYRGNWFRQMPHRALTALIFQTLIFLFVTLWRAGGLMLIGMGLIKLDVLTGKAPRSVYYALVAVGLFVGLPLIAGGLIHFPVSKRDSAEFLFFGVLYNYFGSIALTLGYVGLIMLLCQSRLIGWLHPLAAVGRTALTNYIGQSVICTLVFYGTINPYPLFGRLSWTAQMGVVVAIWVLQLVVATIWLRHFRMGPLEAAWRWSTYGKRSRMHNTAPQPAAPDGAEN